MQLRVLHRRDLAGSMTIVGDMGQATTAASAASWDATLSALQPRRTPTRVDLTVSYRTPEEVLEFARPTLAAAAEDIVPPRPVRRAGFEPMIERTTPAEFASDLARAAVRELAAVAPGRVAVIVTTDRVAEVLALLQSRDVAAVDPRVPGGGGLSADLVVVAAEGANGLEFDSVIVVEPSEIVANAGNSGPARRRGLRTLYVAFTRPTRRLSVLHALTLPETVREK